MEKSKEKPLLRCTSESPIASFTVLVTSGVHDSITHALQCANQIRIRRTDPEHYKEFYRIASSLAWSKGVRQSFDTVVRSGHRRHLVDIKALTLEPLIKAL
ncbi:hypothetical protein NPIL_37191 [Nephila pilipes]|uniref:Uncharacterized protein n=1 Tax=Nephila pilipes TaxID=299642 RepID=A0A8X6N241_NEPPI|nr:hypothetical protein NPIL_37191 [Nephila pilipes]